MDKNHGNLSLKGRKDITELPENLTVGGKVVLAGSGIRNREKIGT